MAYPKNDGSLLEFLHRFQRKRSDVMLCPRCNSVFGREMEENIERVQIASNMRNWRDTHNRFTFNRRGIPRRREQGGPCHHANRPATFKPTVDAPRGKWVKPAEKGGHGQRKWKNFEVERGSSIAYRKEFQAIKPQAYHSDNYKVKKPMSRS